MAKRMSTVAKVTDEEATAALKECFDYLQSALKFLNEKAALPDPSGILKARFHVGSLQANPSNSSDGPQGPVVVLMADPKDPSTTHERLFDPWYFAAMRLFELPGGRFLLRPSKIKYYHIRYAGPTNVSVGYQLSRVIARTPFWADTGHGGPLGKTYRDYRRTSLHFQSKLDIRKLGLKTRSLASERIDAIRFATQLLERKPEGQSLQDRMSISSATYQKLLGASLEIADEVHEKLLIGTK